ncbi:MAG: hypothetical protein Q7S37_01340 [bacterium]|nr:hypothetical protein [bacterium]
MLVDPPGQVAADLNTNIVAIPEVPVADVNNAAAVVQTVNNPTPTSSVPQVASDVNVTIPVAPAAQNTGVVSESPLASGSDTIQANVGTGEANAAASQAGQVEPILVQPVQEQSSIVSPGSSQVNVPPALTPIPIVAPLESSQINIPPIPPPTSPPVPTVPSPAIDSVATNIVPQSGVAQGPITGAQVISPNPIVPVPSPEVNTVPVALDPTLMPSPVVAPQPVPEPVLRLGSIGGSSTLGVGSKEKVSGLVTGSNIKVAKSMEPQGDDNPSEEIPHPIHPLSDLYANLEKMAVSSQLLGEQEMEAERRHQTVEEMYSEALGWQITGKIAHIMMFFSWFLAIVSLLFPLIFKIDSNEQGLSIDFILFVVAIMFLLACTILSFWVRSAVLMKSITWFMFLVFIMIFILISLHSGGYIGDNIPILDAFLNRFSF